MESSQAPQIDCQLANSVKFSRPEQTKLFDWDVDDQWPFFGQPLKEQIRREKCLLKEAPPPHINIEAKIGRCLAFSGVALWESVMGIY